jgi:hypothetical protein
MSSGFSNQCPHPREDLCRCNFENGLMKRRRGKRKMHGRNAGGDGGLEIGLRPAAPRYHLFRTNRHCDRRDGGHGLRSHSRHANFKLGHASVNESPGDCHPI